MDKALQTMINNMPEKTGKSLDQWKKVLAKQSLAKHGEMVKFLKSEHQVTHGFANTIVSLYRDGDQEKGGEDLVTAQYKGKEGLFPVYEKLIKTISNFGKDVEIAPKKTSVSLRRSKQFALIKPATKTRIDLGLKIKGKATTERLEDSGPFGTMCTHRVRIGDVKDVDKELMSWLKEAYEGA